MIDKVDHLGIAVKNLDEALKFFQEVLGLKCEKIEHFGGMKIAFLPVGDSEVELLEDETPQGAIAKFIEKRGEGLQHVALRVKNIREALQAMKEKGIPLIDQEPRPGAGGGLIAFLHPKATHGVLVEFCQREEG